MKKIIVIGIVMCLLITSCNSTLTKVEIENCKDKCSITDGGATCVNVTSDECSSYIDYYLMICNPKMRRILNGLV